MCMATPEALRILSILPQNDKRVFPYGADGISKAFTEACKLLGIEDLHFHDLRHEGISRLFELSMTIPIVPTYFGHRTWKSLERNTNIESVGDHYANWKWWPVIEDAGTVWRR